MAVADLVLLGVLAVSLILGAWRGFVYEVLSVIGWAVSFYLAQWFAPEVATKLPLQGAASPVRYAAAFALIFIAAVFVAGLLAVLIKKLVEAVGLRPVDRTLGAAFGVVRGLILLLAAAVVINMTAFKSSAWWQESQGAEVLSAALRGLKPVLPEQFAKYL
ncbi:MAG TPA: CvpA family protein [Polaromonas sp.]|uniref:CvpA family protein n=1 Tax=Polaromonas sp. TaxID=1869339 RepID=UPI002D29DAD8|nr:CvpA family protein [Polaromonas sp.]HYW58117.1 CvpA family protein [Polaromonas sp.]